VSRHLPDWGDRLSPHVLRHYCASELYLHGMDLLAIQELLGHCWVATTMRYVNPRELHQMSENLQLVSGVVQLRPEAAMVEAMLFPVKSAC
jgi:integrase